MTVLVNLSLLLTFYITWTINFTTSTLSTKKKYVVSRSLAE